MSIRLNPNILPDLLTAIQTSKQNLDTATTQLSSGLSVNQLSDNPSAAAALVLNHNQSRQDDQFVQNLGTLQSKFQVADSTLSNVVTALTRAISIGTEGANGTLNATDQQDVAQEVQGIQQQIAGLANTTYQGTYIFSGTDVATQPFTVDPTTGAVTYNGNSNANPVQLLNGTFVNSGVPGNQLFQNASGSVFGSLQALYTSLQSGNVNNIASAVNQVQSALSQVGVQRVFYGNALNQISSSENFLGQDKINLSTEENTLVAVNPAAAATTFSQSQLAYEGELQATGQVLNLPTLLDFLK